jgi:EmrB/QacA subfamily drug resistance transporter
MEQSLPAADVPPVPRSEFHVAFAGLMLALALAALDQNIVGTALPQIVSDLGGLRHIAWVGTAFLLASTATTPLYGKLSDMYGRKPLFFAAIVIFVGGSALCGQARTMNQLIVYRAVQGLGAGGLMTLAQTTIGDLIAPRERGRYQGLFSAVFAFGSVAGPLLGGLITDALSWPWIFYVNVPVGAAALVLIGLGLRHPPRRQAHRIDYAGAVLLTAGTTCLLLVLSWGGTEWPWASPEVLGLLGASVVLFALLVVSERRAAEPVLPLRLFRNPVVVVSCTVLALTSVAFFGPLFFLPLFFQLVLGASASHAGLMMAPLMAGVIVASVGGGRAVAVFGRYKIFPVVGLAAAALVFLAMAWAAAEGSGLGVFMGLLVVLGLGLGLVMPTLTVAIQNAVERGDLGVATSASAFFRSLGGCLGVAVAGAILTAQLHRLHPGGTAPAAGEGSPLDEGLRRIREMPPDQQAALVEAYRHAIAMTFLAGAVAAALAFAVVLLLPELPLRSADEAPAPRPLPPAPSPKRGGGARQTTSPPFPAREGGQGG